LLEEREKSSRSEEVDEIGHLGESCDIWIDCPVGGADWRGRSRFWTGREATAARVESRFVFHACRNI